MAGLADAIIVVGICLIFYDPFLWVATRIARRLNEFLNSINKGSK